MEALLYTKSYCPFCVKAKELLESKGAKITEIDVEHDERKLKEMVERSGRRTVPQIFINGRHIGGYDELAELERKGKLDGILEE